jgi:hypothetical protein
MRYCLVEHANNYGIRAIHSDVEISNCAILDNQGGIYGLDSSSVSISNSRIEGNSGSGIKIDCNSAVINDNIIRANNAGEYGYGGGIYIYFAYDATVTRNLISENSAEWGGGIKAYCTQCLIQDNRVIGNHASYGAGGITAAPIGGSGVLRVIGNYVSQNTAYGYDYSTGGGIGTTNAMGAMALVMKNVVVDNFATNYPGLWGEGWFINNVVCNNRAPQNSYGISGDQSYVYNCIFWNNGPSEINGDIYPKYCDIMGGYAGEGNIDADPMFRDTTAGDYHLMSTACEDPYNSPCIDAGMDRFMDDSLACDLGLGSRLCDMGAFGGGWQYCNIVAGDANGDGSANGLDVVFLVNYYKGLGYLYEFCRCISNLNLHPEADANGDCVNNGLDVTYLVSYLKGYNVELRSCPDCQPGR